MHLSEQVAYICLPSLATQSAVTEHAASTGQTSIVAGKVSEDSKVVSGGEVDGSACVQEGALGLNGVEHVDVRRFLCKLRKKRRT